MAEKKKTTDFDMKKLEQAILDINDRITELKCEFSEFMDVIIPLLEPSEDQESITKIKEIVKKTKDEQQTGSMYR
jgi:hypothetical protein